MGCWVGGGHGAPPCGGAGWSRGVAAAELGGSRLSEKDLAGEGEVAALCEQVACEMEVDVVVGGEDERLLFGPAGCEELLEAPVVDSAFDCGEVAGDEVAVHADAPSMPS